MKQETKKILFILLLAIISSIPIFYNNKTMFLGHDTVFHLKRILGVVDNISILKALPVYYNYLNHFGYGNGLFYPDIFLYIPAILNKLGISIINSYKIFIFIINILSIISIKICLKKITKNENTTKIGMILYATSLYRFTDMYIRGAIGESLTFIFLPLIILGLYKIFYDNYKEGYYLTIGLVGIMLSHIITLYLIIYVIFFFTIFNYKCLKDKKRLIELIINILFSILITSFFWLPMLEQLMTDKFNLKSHIIIFENCMPIWKLLIDFEYCTDTKWFPAGIGLIYFMLIPLFIKTKEKNKFVNSLLIICISSIILSCSKTLWKIPFLYKLLSIIQIPWRFQSLSTICIIIVTCHFFKNSQMNIIKKATIMYTTVLFAINCILIFPLSNIKINVNNYEDEIMFGEYLPIELKDDYENIINNYKNKNIEYKYEKEKLLIDVVGKTENIELPLIYYKGYVAETNEKELEINKSARGLVNVKINKDTEKITVYYKETTIGKVGKIITIMSTLIYCIIKKYIHNKKNMIK